MNGQLHMSKAERKAARQQAQNGVLPSGPVTDTEVEPITEPTPEAPVTSYPTPAPPQEPQEEFRVMVTVAALSVREEPNVNSTRNQILTDRGIYAIVEQKDGWGRLKSGAGWIALQSTSRVN